MSLILEYLHQKVLPSIEVEKKFWIKCVIQSFLPRGPKDPKIHEVKYYQMNALRGPSGIRGFVADMKLSKLLLINYYFTASIKGGRGMFSKSMEKSINTSLAGGTPLEKSLRQLVENLVLNK